MALTADHTVRDPAQAAIALRRDLRFTPQEQGGQAGYLIEDPLRGKFFRVGVPEFTFITMLDGRTSVAQAMGRCAGVLGPEALNEPECLAVCRWLMNSGLTASSHSSRVESDPHGPDSAKRRSWLNLLAFKIPLLDPDATLERILPWTAWLLGAKCLIAWSVLLVIGIWHLCMYGPEVARNSKVIFRPEHWLTMTLLWLALKLGHEFFHALACKKYGGNVNRAGVMVILLAPVAFVDVTSSWRFPSKWQRIATAAAGMYFELGVAAVSVIVWCHTRDGWIHRLAGEASIIAGVGTLLFNANPLMRFDGYYVLSDLLGIPNLYSSGRQYIANSLEKFALGLCHPPLPVPAGRLKWVGCYGFAALVWRLFVFVSLSVAAVALLSYAGAVVAAVLVWVWFLQPAVMRLRRVLTDPSLRPNPKRVLLAGCAVGAVTMSLVLAVSRPSVLQVPAVVEYSPLSILRTRSPGFVDEVFVRSGDLVEQGQTIATLRNDELRFELAELQLAREQSLVYGRIYAQAGEVAKGQAEAATRRSLEKKIEDLQQRIDSLALRAPISGRIVSRNMQLLKGQYLAEGAQVAVIGGDDKELRLAISQDDIELFQDRIADSLIFCTVGQEAKSVSAVLSKLTPQASLELPHPALSARAGGPLTVRLVDGDNGNGGAQSDCETTAPHFVGTANLDRSASEMLHAGCIAWVTLPSNESVGQHSWRTATEWFRKQLQQARDS